jgi:hypothetical protein
MKAIGDLPDNKVCKTRVSFESLKGTNFSLFAMLLKTLSKAHLTIATTLNTQ